MEAPLASSASADEPAALSIVEEEEEDELDELPGTREGQIVEGVVEVKREYIEYIKLLLDLEVLKIGDTLLCPYCLKCRHGGKIVVADSEGRLSQIRRAKDSEGYRDVVKDAWSEYDCLYTNHNHRGLPIETIRDSLIIMPPAHLQLFQQVKLRELVGPTVADLITEAADKGVEEAVAMRNTPMFAPVAEPGPRQAKKRKMKPARAPSATKSGATTRARAKRSKTEESLLAVIEESAVDTNTSASKLASLTNELFGEAMNVLPNYQEQLLAAPHTEGSADDKPAHFLLSEFNQALARACAPVRKVYDQVGALNQLLVEADEKYAQWDAHQARLLVAYEAEIARVQASMRQVEQAREAQRIAWAQERERRLAEIAKREKERAKIQERIASFAQDITSLVSQVEPSPPPSSSASPPLSLTTSVSPSPSLATPSTENKQE